MLIEVVNYGSLVSNISLLVMLPLSMFELGFQLLRSTSLLTSSLAFSTPCMNVESKLLG